MSLTRIRRDSRPRGSSCATVIRGGGPCFLVVKINATKSSCAASPLISYAYEVKEVKVNGDEAVVLVEQKDKRIQLRRDGKPHKVEANVIHRDTWVRTGEGWKLRRTEELKQTKFTVDGKSA